MSAWDDVQHLLPAEPKTWLVTGAAGFIGSNLAEILLRMNQRVIGLDNFSTGSWANLEQVRALVGPERWRSFQIFEGDIQDLDLCQRACRGVEYVLHQAARGSVPRSIADPKAAHDSNVTGFLNMLMAARDNRARRFVYASSSSVYGDDPQLPKIEARLGRCLSPYAVTKRMNELYAEVFSLSYGLPFVGLRYFNVFGPRQDPAGPYAAVIPKWIEAMIKNEPLFINGDGETSRDFCYVANVLQANLLAATVENPAAVNQVYNIAAHTRTTLNQLFEMVRARLRSRYAHLHDFRPTYRDFRPGDVRHSEADVTKAQTLLGYSPTHTVEQGLAEALDWYCGHATDVASPRMVSTL